MWKFKSLLIYYPPKTEGNTRGVIQMTEEQKYKDIKLYPNEELTIKCLKENLNKYIDDEFAHRITEQINDFFILNHINTEMLTERVKKSSKTWRIKTMIVYVLKKWNEECSHNSGHWGVLPSETGR